MTNDQFKRAFAIADERDETGRCLHDLSGEEVGHLDGYGLRDFTPTVATVRQVASVMRWQALFLNGKWDMEELNSIRDLLRRKVTILD